MDITYYEYDRLEAENMEAGLIAEGWKLRVDARIRTATDAVGVGPLVLQPSTLSTVTDACIFFYRPDGVSVSLIEDAADPEALELAVVNFMQDKGANITRMLSFTPEVI